MAFSIVSIEPNRGGARFLFLNWFLLVARHPNQSKARKARVSTQTSQASIDLYDVIEMAVPKNKERKPKLQRFTEKQFLPYVIAVGQVALAWNDLYDHLARLFIILMDNDDERRSLIIWHASPLDRPKRELLRLLTADIISRNELHLFPKFERSMKWLLKNTNDLEDSRNNAVHAALVLISDSPLGAYSVQMGGEPVIPSLLYGNPRSVRLAGKTNLLGEFRFCRDTAIVLRNFAWKMNMALTFDDAWPGIPKLPSLRRRRLRKRSRSDK